MRPDHRKHKRQELHYRAYVDLCDGTPPQLCQLLDVSEHGAQLNFDSADVLPDQFDLLLAKGTNARRRCSVVWRADTRVGIQFLRTDPEQTRQPAKRRG